MAVPKKRVSIPENAKEVWDWADNQINLSASLVLVVKAFIAKYGNGDAICAYSFDSADDKRERKPRAKRSDRESPDKSESTVQYETTAVLQNNEKEEVTPEQVNAQQPVSNPTPAPQATSESMVFSAPAMQEQASVPQSAPAATDNILSQLAGNSNNESETSNAANDMLASMLNI